MGSLLLEGSVVGDSGSSHFSSNSSHRECPSAVEKYEAGLHHSSFIWLHNFRSAEQERRGSTVGYCSSSKSLNSCLSDDAFELCCSFTAAVLVALGFELLGTLFFLLAASYSDTREFVLH